MRFPRRWRLWHGLAGLALLAGAVTVTWLYTHPPLSSWGSSQGALEGRGMVAYDLQNDGWFPVVLTGVSVVGAPTPTSISAAANRGELASSSVFHPDERRPDQAGEVRGWRVPPRPAIPRTSHAVVLRWGEQLLPPAPYVVELNYRYLGLPMRLHLEGQ